ncbi:hypothetical protein Aph02nite_52430 [Actinoplanes philippinensis]|uniref:DUF695 domain-containing protein n=1 Tax=Actinoplanes philippinensis TaxID=35752 RepID=A0A1I2IJA7_9ACTN|nr:DUF695 domain-containing protein [Actinoplanes philippinensis]GIE79293.1 hypothetical protein Aph02nite_52430 [Actinoplanes philippinensis]SFF42324.1 Family of unknown function [Actinoplanes philippinensis]
MLFKKRRKAGPEDAITAFWTWWAGARPRAERMIGGGSDDTFIEETAGLIAAIHPDLHWEFAAGRTSRHLLVVSSGGSPELRSLAERWRRAGPPPDETFGYAAARQGRPDALEGARLALDGHQLDLDDLRFRAEHDEERDCLDVEVWHPDFARLPEEPRGQIAYLSLDWLLGEDTVEIWVGGIEAVTTAGPGLTGPELAALVADMLPADGQPRWRNMSGRRAGKPIIAMAQTRLRPARWPGHDLHIRMDVPYTARDENGFPQREALAALHAFENHVAEHADGMVVVAHETTDGVRTTHLYADSPVAAEVLKPLIAGWQDGRVQLTVTPDPRWEQVEHLAA